jgi:hypothetical protein
LVKAISFAGAAFLQFSREGGKIVAFVNKK